MRERKYVKFRTDMYEDTKFKIIDRKPERDLINYVWTRLVTLAGKVNLAGDLYLSRNIPYTIETLAIEFNRNIEEIKIAVNTFLELEMLELKDNAVYCVINFARHQNIKTKEKSHFKTNNSIAIEQQLDEKENYETNKYTNNNLETTASKGSNDLSAANKIIRLNNNNSPALEEHTNSIANSDQNLSNSDADNTTNNPNAITTNNVSNSNKIYNIDKDISTTSNVNSKSLAIKNNKDIKKEEVSCDVMSIDDDDPSNNFSNSFFEGDAPPLGKNDRIIAQWSF